MIDSSAWVAYWCFKELYVLIWETRTSDLSLNIIICSLIYKLVKFKLKQYVCMCTQIIAANVISIRFGISTVDGETPPPFVFLRLMETPNMGVGFDSTQYARPKYGGTQ